MFDYEEIPLHWVNRLGFLVRKELSRRFDAAGYPLSAEEWAVLLMVWETGESREQEPAGKEPGQIAAATFRDRTTVTRLIDGMIKKDLVERHDDPSDRRKSRIVPSAHGQAIREPLIKIARGLIEETLWGLSKDEVETSVRVMRKMVSNLLPLGEAPKAGKQKREIKDV
jgi:DNA-binding MarR family transcriptional regulator